MKQLLPITLSAILLLGFVQPSLAYSREQGKILKKNGDSIQLHGVNWFGFETQNHVVHGLWARSYKKMIKQMKSIGVNAVRLPVCPGTLDGAAVSPFSIDYEKNPELVNLNSLQILDKIVKRLNKAEIYILLDHHNMDCSTMPELWYSDTYRKKEWIADLVFMAERYADLKYFIGLDLKNEPHGAATWGTKNKASDWDSAAEKASAAVLEANPNLLIFVQGIQESSTCSTAELIAHWRGGNFEPLQCAPLNIPESQLVLSPHVYGPDVYPQTYFSATDFPDNMRPIWNTQFGFAKKDGYTLVIGEFGGKYGNGGNPLDVAWHDAFVNYLDKKKIRHSFYWSWNPNSGDTGGILQDDWKTLHANKVELLQRLWAD